MTKCILVLFIFVAESLCEMELIQNNAPLFGTDGIRRTIGTPPLSYEQLPQLGRAIAQWAHQRYGAHPRILLASDTRQSCAFVKSALESGLLLSRVQLFDALVLPTPAAHLLLKQTGSFDCAIIISASHNKYRDNGIKIIDAKKNKLSLADEQEISSLMQRNQHEIEYDDLGSLAQWPEAEQIYADFVIAQFPISFLSGKKIVLDCANGATYKLAPLIFRQLGAEVIVLNDKPNGKNINHLCGAVHPEQLQHAVQNHAADIGFAFDGDGDRIIAVNKDGNVKDGDGILALLSHHPNYAQETTIVGTVMSNQGFNDYLNSHSKQLIRAAVGDKNVLNELIAHQSLLGGEPSGHIILRDYLDSGDGIMSALRIMQTLIMRGNDSIDFFSHYPQLLINIPVAQKKDLNDPNIAACIAGYESQLGKGRILVRYSGTENLLRIMVESHNSQLTERIANLLAQELITLL